MSLSRSPGFGPLFLAAPAILASLVPACGGDGALPAAMVHDSAGVTIVVNPGEDRLLPLAFVEEFRLGGSDTREEEGFYEVSSSTVGVDGSGRIHVLDTSARRVFVFDDRGRHLFSAGRPGEGPGELGFPGGLVVTRDGRFAVVDFSRRGLVHFADDGSLLPSIPFPPGFFGGRVHLDDTFMVMSTRRVTDGGTRTVQELLRVSEADTISLVRAERPASGAIVLESCGIGFSAMEPIFTPGMQWAARSGRVIVASDAHYSVRVLEDGVERIHVRRQVLPREATASLARQEVGDDWTIMTSGGPRVCDAGEAVEKRGFGPLVPTIDWVEAAPDGSIWVGRKRVGEEPGSIDLFDADGEYLGTLPPGSPRPVAFFPDGRIAVAESDEYEVTRLVVYRPERT